MPQNHEPSLLSKVKEEIAKSITTALDQIAVTSLESAGFLSDKVKEVPLLTMKTFKETLAQLDASLPKSDFVYAPVSAQDIERIESSPRPRLSMSHMLYHRKKRIRKKWRKRLPSRSQVEWEYTKRVLPPGYALIDGKFYAFNMKRPKLFASSWDLTPRIDRRDLLCAFV